ncbi:unnamed protein product [Rhizophagus irregularis]|nr:unnamed protein product [Rhizophagus irregularis]
MSKEEHSKLRHPDYWGRDPNTWGTVNDWDIYWIEQSHSVPVNKKNSHSALADELRTLKQIFDSTKPAYKIMENTQNYKVWEKKYQITSLKIESDLIDLELEIDRKRGRQSVHKITQQGFKIAQQGLQECADTEFDAMERGKKRIRTGQEVSPLRAVTPPPFKLSQVQPRTSENKVRSTASETEVKSTYSDLTFSDESLSSSIPLTNDFSETTSQESPMSNQELEDTETIPPIIINEDGDVITDKKMMRDAYLKIRQDLCDHSSQKDWFIEGYNVSDAFRKYQISNIDKLVAGETFHFSSEILSLHNIMFIDLTTMKKPLYLDIDDERKWRVSIRQQKQQTPPSFFREIMDEYEMVKAECANKGFQKYWEKLIYEKKEMSVNRIHLMNSMDMYGSHALMTKTIHFKVQMKNNPICSLRDCENWKPQINKNKGDDWKIAKNWDKECKLGKTNVSSININHSTNLGSGIGIIERGTFTSEKKGQKKTNLKYRWDDEEEIMNKKFIHKIKPKSKLKVVRNCEFSKCSYILYRVLLTCTRGEIT